MHSKFWASNAALFDRITPLLRLNHQEGSVDDWLSGLKGAVSAPHALKTLVTISKDERAPHAARVSASQAILDRAYGKAPTLNTSDPTVMKRAIDMTDDELAAIASGATLHVVK